MSQMGKFSGGLLGIPINTITGNVGGAVGPDVFSNVDLLGSSPITVTGNPAAWTLTITVDSATTTSEGVVELATDAESIAGTDTTRAIVPSSLLAKLGVMTANGVAYGAGTAAAMSWTAAGLDGELLIGATGAAPAFASLTSVTGNIVYVAGANSLDLDVGNAVATSYVTDVGGPVVLTGSILGVNGGNNITTDGTVADIITIDLTGTTQYAVQVGDATGSLDSLAVGTDGQVLIGATGADPAFATITSAGGTIAFTPGANSLNMETAGTIATSFPTDAGIAIPAAGVLNVLSAVGGNIGTTGVGNTVSISVTGTTQYSVQVGDATGSLDSLAVGLDGEVLIGATGAAPAFAALASVSGHIVYATGANSLDLDVGNAVATSYVTDVGGPVVLTGSILGVNGGNNITTDGTVADIITIDLTGTTQYAVQVGDATGSLDSLAVGTTNTVLLGNTGANPSWGQVDLTTDVTGILPVANGGTGVNTLTDGGIMLGSGVGAVTSLAQATNGQLPIGSTGADPVLATLTAGTDIGIANAAGSITVSYTGTGAVPWTEVTGTTQAAAVNNGYICNNAALVTVTLPDTAAFGSIIRVGGKGAGLFRIAQNAGETIHFGSTSTTTGAGGYIEATIQYAAVELVCITADTDWLVLSSSGNFTIV